MIYSFCIFLGLLTSVLADIVTLKVVAKDNFVYGYATSVSADDTYRIFIVTDVGTKLEYYDNELISGPQDEEKTAVGFVNMFLAMGKNFVAPKFYFDSNKKMKSDKNSGVATMCLTPRVSLKITK